MTTIDIQSHPHYLDFFFNIINDANFSLTLLELLGLEQQGMVGENPAEVFEDLMTTIMTRGNPDTYWNPTPQQQYEEFIQRIKPLWAERCDHESKRENGRGRHGCNNAELQNAHYSKLAFRVLLKGLKYSEIDLYNLINDTKSIMSPGNSWSGLHFNQLYNREDFTKLLKPHMKVWFRTILRWLKIIADNSVAEQNGRPLKPLSGRPYNWTEETLNRRRARDTPGNRS